MVVVVWRGGEGRTRMQIFQNKDLIYSKQRADGQEPGDEETVWPTAKHPATRKLKPETVWRTAKHLGTRR